MAGGAGYDVSASTARALASSANQSAPTIFNFSSPGSWFGGTDQTSNPSASATAATKSPGTTGGGIWPGFGGTGGDGAGTVKSSPWFMVSAVAGILSLLFLVFHKR